MPRPGPFWWHLRRIVWRYQGKKITTSFRARLNQWEPNSSLRMGGRGLIRPSQWSILNIKWIQTFMVASSLVSSKIKQPLLIFNLQLQLIVTIKISVMQQHKPKLVQILSQCSEVLVHRSRARETTSIWTRWLKAIWRLTLTKHVQSSDRKTILSPIPLWRMLCTRSRTSPWTKKMVKTVLSMSTSSLKNSHRVQNIMWQLIGRRISAREASFKRDPKLLLRHQSCILARGIRYLHLLLTSLNNLLARKAQFRAQGVLTVAPRRDVASLMMPSGRELYSQYIRT